MDLCLRRLADYFLAQKNASNVDPAAIDPQLLPHIFIIDVERDINVRLRIRLVGTALDSMFKQPLVGHLLEEFVHGPRGREVITSFLHCARTREPLWMRQVLHQKNKAPRFVEGVAVYLEPERIYGGLVFGEFCNPDAEAGFDRMVLSRSSG